MCLCCCYSSCRCVCVCVYEHGVCVWRVCGLWTSAMIKSRFRVPVLALSLPPGLLAVRGQLRPKAISQGERSRGPCQPTKSWASQEESSRPMAYEQASRRASGRTRDWKQRRCRGSGWGTSRGGSARRADVALRTAPAPGTPVRKACARVSTLAALYLSSPAPPLFCLPSS